MIRWLLGFMLASATAFYVVRSEMRQAELRREIASLEHRTRAAVGLIIQATANVHQRVRMLEARRNPGGEF